MCKRAILLKGETRWQNKSAILNKFGQQGFNIMFSIHFGLVWNEMQSSLPTEIDARRNHDNFRIVAGSLPYKSRNFGIKISHGCRQIAFCPVGYFNLSHPVELYLQWPTNRKSYMVYRTASFSMTLNDPNPRFQGHVILWRWIIWETVRNTDIVSMKY